MPTDTLRPVAGGSSGGWTGSHPSAVGDNSDATALFATDNNDAFTCVFDNLNPLAATVVSPINVNMRYSRSDTAAATVNCFVDRSGNVAYGGAQTGTSITTHSYSQARPGGGSYTVAEINSQTGGVLAASGVPGEEAYVYDTWWNVGWWPQPGGFVALVGSLVGAALGLSEMANLARVASRLSRTIITPDEYAAAWREIRTHPRTKTFDLGARPTTMHRPRRSNRPRWVGVHPHAGGLLA